MPIPRLTSMPGASSRAIRRAMTVCASIGSSKVLDEIVDDWRRRYDVIRREYPDRNDMVGAGNHRIGGHRDHRIEIAGGQRVAQIAGVIGEKVLHESEIRTQRDFEQIVLAGHLDALLPGLDRRAN